MFKNGAKMLYTSTAYGDGSYIIYTSFNFKKDHAHYAGVDAGMLCVISVEDALLINPDFDIENKYYPIIENVTGRVYVEDHNLCGDLKCDTEN
jgi:hypothetical protein